MGPRPQGGVRCCLGKPFAPVTIVAPTPDGSDRPGAARGAATAVVFLSGILASRPPSLRPGQSGRHMGKHLYAHGRAQEHRCEHDRRTTLARARLGGCHRPRWFTRTSVLRAELSRCGSQPAQHLSGTQAPLARWRHQDRHHHGTADNPERHRGIQCLADASLATSRIPNLGCLLHPAGGERDEFRAGVELLRQRECANSCPLRLSGAARASGHRLDVPDSLQPGDTIVPTFQITNLGTANTDTQGPVQVALVESVTPTFTLGSTIVATYTLPSGIPGQSDAPVRNTLAVTRVSSGRAPTTTL